MQERALRLTEHPYFQRTIITLIIINAIILGLETYDAVMQRFGPALLLIDSIILAVFVLEITLRLIAHRLRFFTQPWSVFDFLVVAIALVPATGAFASLRALRVLRVLRLVSAIPKMRMVVEGLLAAIPGIASVAAIMLLFFYVFAVIGTHLYGDSFPDWFGSLGKSMFTLFQIMTLESWAMGVVRPVMEVHPSAWLFFILYILVTTFTMLNLFIAVIVNAMHSGADAAAAESRQHLEEHIIQEIRALEKKLLEANAKRRT